ncbi:hypothetical protein LZ32DRAFT_602254 [Colletotrichum eremochloae]|nr:hypothetical protein LZ32DRAFT_602254 [Colletotrichum eremochloae]
MPHPDRPFAAQSFTPDCGLTIFLSSTYTMRDAGGPSSLNPSPGSAGTVTGPKLPRLHISGSRIQVTSIALAFSLMSMMAFVLGKHSWLQGSDCLGLARLAPAAMNQTECIMVWTALTSVKQTNNNNDNSSSSAFVDSAEPPTTLCTARFRPVSLL